MQISSRGRAVTVADGSTVGIHVRPTTEALEEAVRRAGAAVVALEEADAIVCIDDDVEWLRAALLPKIRWVQLGAAGIEMWLEAGVMKPDVAWTAAKGVYARPIAEHVVALMLAASRNLPDRIRASAWGPQSGRLLHGRTVGVVGAGGIGEDVLALLAPFGMRTIALTRSARPIGADSSIGPAELDWLLAESDYVVLAAPATPETAGMISAARIALLRPGAWLINIARGSLVDTDALVSALASGAIGGAALDVTDPEPLPEGHPLWSLPNAIITPHVASTLDMGLPFLAQRVEKNVGRFARGERLLGLVDLELGY